METAAPVDEGIRWGRALADADLSTTVRLRIEPLFAAPWSWYGAEEHVEAGRAALARCVGRARSSHSGGWSDRPSVHDAGAAGFGDLIDLRSIAQLLAEHPLQPPVFELRRDGEPAGRMAPAIAQEPLDRIHRPSAESAIALAQLIEGAALVINDAQALWPPLEAFCRQLAVGLGVGATADVHLALTPGRGIVDHVALDDAFVLQVAGTTRWKVSGWASEDAPSWSPELSGGIGGPMTLDVDLLPGCCLTVPRGFCCSSFDDDGPTLAIVVWADGRAVGSAPPTVPGERYWTCRSAIGSSAIDDLLAAQAVTPSSLVTRRSGAVVWTRSTSDRFLVRIDQREIAGPSWLQALVDPLLAGPPVRVADLAGGGDAADVVVLVRRLVREGILAVV